MAEREGFEPSVEFPLHTLSKRARSTTPTSLRFRINELRAVPKQCSAKPSFKSCGPANSFVFSDLRTFVNQIVSGIVSDILVSRDHLRRFASAGFCWTVERRRYRIADLRRPSRVRRDEGSGC